MRYLNKRIRRVRYIDKNTLQSLTFVLGMVRYQIGSVAERTGSRRESGHTLIVRECSLCALNSRLTFVPETLIRIQTDVMGR